MLLGSDVTGVVLTMGESGTHRALESVEEQVPALREVIVIPGARPFSAALNRAVERVRTPYFVQVDSDMSLDPDCVRRLRDAMLPDVGIAAGLLRDPLMGEIGAVKLFRTECFDTARLRDTISTDVDFYREIAPRWLTVYVLAAPGPVGTRALGSHRPAYSASYTYATSFLLGARCWQLRDLMNLRWRLRRLRSSRHALAPLATMALGHGLFSDETRDVGKESVRLPPDVLRRLARVDRAPVPSGGGLPPETACELFEHGRQLGARRACSEVKAWLRRLGAATDDADPWPLEVSLSHGFLGAVEGSSESYSPWNRLRELVTP